MKCVLIIFAIFIVLLVSTNFALADFVWKRQDFGFADADLKIIVVGPIDPDTIYLGTSKGIFKSIDSGDKWEECLGFTVGSVNSIAIDKRNSFLIYAATGSGIFKSINAGKNWSRVSSFFKQGERINHILISDAEPNLIFCATEKGLVLSDDNLSSLKMAPQFSGKEINFIAESPQDKIILAAAGGEIFKSTDKGLNWKKVFSLVLSGKENEADEIEIETDEPLDEIIEKNKKINCIAFDLFDENRAYIGTNRGIYISKDIGDSWERFDENGLLGVEVYDILILPLEPDLIFTATDKGVFEYSKKANDWKWLYKGSLSQNSVDIAFDSKDNRIWMATQKELYSADLSKVALSEPREDSYYTSKYFAQEPTIIEVQQAAIEYAEVYPEKIWEWRKDAGKRAWLPRLSVGYDEAKSDTYEIYTSGSSSYYVLGPEDISSGWDVTLTWDLADLVWNPSQKDIDVRSRLMVELRNDIVNEVTRVYFERRRLQIELISKPPQDLNKRMDKGLRIMELTAVIDGYTGGYFTKNSKNDND